MAEEKTFTNTKGTFRQGDPVWFDVENSSQWAGDREGILHEVGGEFCIQTLRSGIVTIGKGYDAYPNSIRKPMKSIQEQIYDALGAQSARNLKRQR